MERFIESYSNAFRSKLKSIGGPIKESDTDTAKRIKSAWIMAQATAEAYSKFACVDRDTLRSVMRDLWQVAAKMEFAIRTHPK